MSLADVDCTDPRKMDIGMHKDRLWAILIELDTKGYINLTKSMVCIKDEGRYYLERTEAPPTNKPKKYAKKITLKTIINQYKDNIWAATIIGGLIVLILGTYILYKIGIIH